MSFIFLMIKRNDIERISRLVSAWAFLAGFEVRIQRERIFKCGDNIWEESLAEGGVMDGCVLSTTNSKT